MIDPGSALALIFISLSAWWLGLVIGIRLGAREERARMRRVLRNALKKNRRKK